MMIVLNMIFGDDDAAAGGWWVMVMTIMSERSLYRYMYTRIYHIS